MPAQQTFTQEATEAQLGGNGQPVESATQDLGTAVRDGTHGTPDERDNAFRIGNAGSPHRCVRASWPAFSNR